LAAGRAKAARAGTGRPGSRGGATHKGPAVGDHAAAARLEAQHGARKGALLLAPGGGGGQHAGVRQRRGERVD
jgi:hypothetical protein